MSEVHRADIQGLRGVAVLMVVAYHAGFLPGGFAGVDVFFVISGYVISQSIIGLKDISFVSSLRQFYSRRARRILPVLLVFALTIVLVSHAEIFATGASEVARTGLFSLLSITNISFAISNFNYFSSTLELNPLSHTWSLAVEEQFYLVFPLLMFGVILRMKSRRIGVAFLLLLGIISLALSVWLTSKVGRIAGLHAQMLAFYLPVTRSSEFLAGAISAMVLPSSVASAKWSRSAVATGFVLVGVISVGASEGSWPGVGAIVPVVGTVLLLTSGRYPHAFSHSLMGSASACGRLLGWIGDRSYSWYLWHWPLLLAARQTAIPRLGGLRDAGFAAVALLLAHTTYSVIEQPWRGRRPLSAKQRRLGIGSLAVIGSFIALLAGLFSASSNESTPDIENAFVAGDCRVLETYCIDKTAFSGPTLFLVGDSHAASLARVIRDIADEVNLPLVIATRPGCPLINTDWGFFLGDFAETNRSTNLDCRQHYQETFAMIRTTDFPIVLTTEYSALYVPDTPLAPIFDLRVTCPLTSSGTCAAPNTLEFRRTFFLTNYRESIDRLLSLDSQVLLVTSVPLMPRLTAVLTNSDGRLTFPRAGSEVHAQSVTTEKNRWAQGDKAIQVINPFDILCNKSECVWSDAGRTFYIPAASANDHLSTEGANMLRPMLMKAIATALRQAAQ